MVEDSRGTKIHLTWRSMLMIWGLVATTILNTGTVLNSAKEVRDWIFNSGVQSEQRHEETIKIIEDNKNLTEKSIELSQENEKLVNETATILQRLDALERKKIATIPEAESATDQHEIPKYVSCCVVGKPCKHGQVHCAPTSTTDDQQ